MADRQPAGRTGGLGNALAKAAYAQDRVRLADSSLAGSDCLVASRQGLFAVCQGGAVRQLAWGRFFGLREHGGHIYAFEACDWPESPSRMGRIVRFSREGGQLARPVVLIKGLDNNCHQIAVIGGVLHVVDTAHQQVARFTLDGEAIDCRPVAERFEGQHDNPAYRHINSIAGVAGGIALLLHNGGEKLGRPSELLLLDADWQELGRTALAGMGCHDIVADDDGTLWHCGSLDGEIINSRGERWKVSDMMTRGLARTPQGWIAGYSWFGARKGRETLPGGVLYLDSQLRPIAEVPMAAAPTDLIMRS